MSTRVQLLLKLLLVIFMTSSVHSQDACERLSVAELGSTDGLESSGLISDILTPGGEASGNLAVQLLEINIVCEAQHEMEDRYRYTSVVVSFNCFTTDTRIPECNNSSVVNTEQFDFGCSGGTWTTNILSISNSARTTNPTATLTTEPDTGCILCINPANPVVGSRVVSNVTHCQACANCPVGLQRCYFDSGFNQICCNYFHQGVCVAECPSSFAPSTNFECVETTTIPTERKVCDIGCIIGIIVGLILLFLLIIIIVTVSVVVCRRSKSNMV